MTDAALERFRQFLSRHGVAIAAVERDVLMHEMGATINRHRLTGRDEGIQAFNTSQLAGLVIGQTAWTRDQPFVTGLILSSLIDGDLVIYDVAMAEGLLPESWTWIKWAYGFTGDETELLNKLSDIAAVRERCGAVCLAIRNNAKAIGSRLLGEFCKAPLAKVYHHLLRTALSGPAAATLAAGELARLPDQLEVLFASDTDMTLAALVKASTLDHPETAVIPFKDAADEMTRIAIAQRHLERGRAAEALAAIKDLRVLSVTYDQAILIAALAALECHKFEMAEFYSRNIADVDTRLKIVSRIAQANGDPAAEMDALISLYERNPHDAQVFTILINALLRIGQTAMARALCAEAQERYIDDPVVEQTLRLVLSGNR